MGTTTQTVRTAIGRGLRKRCPHCGRGRLFHGWTRHLDRCSACGLVFERNPGDTWFFTVVGDRIPIVGMIALVYFGVARTHPVLGAFLFVLLVSAILWTAPNRWGLGIALHYLSRLYWSSPDDPLPLSRDMESGDTPA